jgi:hypothetical protein
MDRSHPNLLPLLSNGDIRAPEDLKHQDTHGSMAASTRFGAQEQRSRAISPKIVEQQLEGDKDTDLMSSQPCGQGPMLDSASSFNFTTFFFSLGFFSPMEAILDFHFSYLKKQ